MSSDAFLRFCGCALMLLGWGAVGLRGEMDRHPELKSRAVAWTPYDGSFLIDTNSRAEVLDFYWTVLRAPYEPMGWTGSLATRDPGTTSEAWRVREYAQLNAYRALAGLNAVEEDPSLLPAQQEGALVMALNQRLEHRIDPTWLAYSDAARIALGSSSLDAHADDPRNIEDGIVDGLVHDAWSDTPIFVGHRRDLLYYTLRGGGIGGVKTPYSGVDFFATWTDIRVQHDTDFNTVRFNAFVAWPAPGAFPKALLRSRPSAPLSSPPFRWTFESPWEGSSDFDFDHVVIKATCNGKEVIVRDPQKHPFHSQWTWYFDPSEVNPWRATDDSVEITITGAVIRDTPWSGGPISYNYTVRLFDETQNPAEQHFSAPGLSNISTRGIVGEGDQQLISGLMVDGTEPIRVLIRVLGPSLSRFGVLSPSGKLHLRLFDAAGVLVGENNGWRTHVNWRLIEGVGLSPGDDSEPALIATLWPGRYTVVVDDAQRRGGIAVVEAFNIDRQPATRLVNLSSRGYVGAGEQQLIVGFVVNETGRLMLLRAQGPSLQHAGVNAPVKDTKLAIFSQVDGRCVGTNDDWASDSNNAPLRAALAGYAPRDPRESALLLNLPAGAYSVIVSSANDAGIAIAEIFDLGAR